MKFILAAALLLVVSLRAETVSAGIAATVNGDPITQAEMDHQVDSFFANSDLQGNELQTARQEYRQQVLQALIERRLILQAFAREGEKLPDGMIDLRLDAIIAENYGGDRNAFLSTIKTRASGKISAGDRGQLDHQSHAPKASAAGLVPFPARPRRRQNLLSARHS